MDEFSNLGTFQCSRRQIRSYNRNIAQTHCICSQQSNENVLVATLKAPAAMLAMYCPAKFLATCFSEHAATATVLTTNTTGVLSRLEKALATIVKFALLAICL